MGHHGHEFPTHQQPFPPSHPAQRKAKSGLTKGDGEEKIPAEEKERAAKSLSFAPSSTRAFQGNPVRWQLGRRPRPAPCVRPGQELTARSWLWLAFVPLALLSLSQRELFPPQRRVPRGPARGAPRRQRGAGGAQVGGTPGTTGYPRDNGVPEGRMEETKAAEAQEMGWRRGGAVPLPGAHRGEREVKGGGAGKAAGGRPSRSPSPG